MSHDHHKENDSCCSHHHHDHSCCHESHEPSCCSDHSHQEDFPHQLLQVADEAWMEVLKEKIKAEILHHNGAQLDALAKLVSETNNHRWSGKLGLQNTVDDFKCKLDQIFKK